VGDNWEVRDVQCGGEFPQDSDPGMRMVNGEPFVRSAPGLDSREWVIRDVQCGGEFLEDSGSGVRTGNVECLVVPCLGINSGPEPGVMDSLVHNAGSGGKVTGSGIGLVQGLRSSNSLPGSRPRSWWGA
jgi:hypothetical protein